MAIPSVRSKRDFDLIYKKGKMSGGDFFSLRILKCGNSEPTRFGIIISTKISKKAVVRNKKRRQLKEIIRLNREKITNGYLALITLKEKGLEAEYGELEKELMRLLEKAGASK